jgi:hypothetical protein
MGNWSSRPRLEAFRSRSLIKMSRGGTPQAISSESCRKAFRGVVSFDFLRTFLLCPVFDHRRAQPKALAAFDCRWFVA